MVKMVLRKRVTLLLALLAVLTVTFVAPEPAAQAVCPDAAVDFYYSDATMTVKVGECRHACCQLWTCTGEVTMYGRTVMRRSCSVE